MRVPTRRTKIVCTLGPAVASLEAVTKLIETGMDVARINFSHGSHEAHAQTIAWVREASKNLQIPVAILGDLQGPKIRTGKLAVAENAEKRRLLPLKTDQKLWFVGIDPSTPSVPGDGSQAKPISISYARLAADLGVGDRVLFEDGLIRMTVIEKIPDKNLIHASVEHGEALGENKGVNMPGARLSTLGITEKDWDDILFAFKENVDFLALSFVRSSREIKNLKKLISEKNLGIHVIAKIEMGQAIENIDDIMEHTDGIMVARGDLGVEIGNEKVPVVQKTLIKKAREAGKPVITATQMLMSMVQAPSPTRAEASDVANAVLDGSDALMLSNETATGSYPFESVHTMSVIIQGAETLDARQFGMTPPSAISEQHSVLPISEAIESAAMSLAENLRVKCLACLTRSGQAARLLAKYRPAVPIFAFAESEKVRHQLSLTWGVSVIPWKEAKHKDYTIFDELLEELARLNLVRHGDLSVMTAGIPTSLKVGSTNTVVVKRFTQDQNRH